MLYSPKQVSQAIGVSEASLKRWCDQGRLSFTRTPGGHRRISRDAVLRFVRENHHDLVAPTLLGLPGREGGRLKTDELSVVQVTDLLIAGDEPSLRSLVAAYCLAKKPLGPLFDNLLAPAFKLLGCEWAAGRAEIYQEHRACEMCRRLVAEILQVLPLPGPSAPLALGGALAGDPYDLGSVMVEASLRDLGWDARSLGSNLPVASMANAVEALQPKLFWLSISTVAHEDKLVEDCAALYHTCLAHHCLLVIGGMALGPECRGRLAYSCHCDTIDDLVNFITSMTVAGGLGASEARFHS